MIFRLLQLVRIGRNQDSKVVRILQAYFIAVTVVHDDHPLFRLIDQFQTDLTILPRCVVLTKWRSTAAVERRGRLARWMNRGVGAGQ